jgi:glyoxylase-like metal-dependent hydrolase (beta-lactamase superfamily II)
MAIVVKDETIQIDRLELGPFGTNTYILTCRETGDCVVVDAPGDASRVTDLLREKNPKYILITHGHFDHLGSLAELKSALGIPVGAHTGDAGQLPVQADLLMDDGDEISFGAIDLRVLHTPGHTPGSICLLVGSYLIAGDTLFPNGPGNTPSPANFQKILESITQKLFTLPEDTQVYPGHGEASTIGKEKRLFEVFSAQPRDPNLCGDVVWVS